MSGCNKGVQKLFQDEVPQAIYTHCYNHRLNLVLVDVCGVVPEIENFFCVLQMLYKFMSRSSVHPDFISLQKDVLKMS